MLPSAWRFERTSAFQNCVILKSLRFKVGSKHILFSKCWRFNFKILSIHTGLNLSQQIRRRIINSLVSGCGKKHRESLDSLKTWPEVTVRIIYKVFPLHPFICNLRCSYGGQRPRWDSNRKQHTTTRGAQGAGLAKWISCKNNSLEQCHFVPVEKNVCTTHEVVIIRDTKKAPWNST